jgi:serine/threonine protein kinase
VKEGFDTQLHRLCAIKIIKKRSLQKIPGGEESVEKEVEVLKKLHHENCIHLFDFFQDEEKGKL